MDTYEQKYKEALGWMKSLYGGLHGKTKEEAEKYFPELQKSEDEKIREALIDGFTVMKESKNCGKTFSNHNIPVTDILAWLEKQGKGTSWKPSKEEMDVLYSLAYITNQYDEHKETVITRLYQDLKREFFNGSSYENMFPTNTSTEEDVRRRSTIQVLEYARSLDTYNQYGKADIDKNIAWLEKQGETFTNKDVEDAYLQGVCDAKQELEKQGEPFDDNIITRDDEILQAISIGLTDAEKDLGWSDFGGLPIEEIHAWLEKQGQKPKWTDEDEKRLQSCISELQGKGLMGGVDTIDTKWLKSLKQRMEQ